MAYCPFYSKQCPEDSSCAVHRSYGCGASFMPGTPAIYNGGESPVEVFIIKVFCGAPKSGEEILIVYCNRDTGIISTSDTLSDFVVSM